MASLLEHTTIGLTDMQEMGFWVWLIRKLVRECLTTKHQRIIYSRYCCRLYDEKVLVIVQLYFIYDQKLFLLFYILIGFKYISNSFNPYTSSLIIILRLNISAFSIPLTNISAKYRVNTLAWLASRYTNPPSLFMPVGKWMCRST